MKGFLKAAAVCSALGAITTALLIFLPVPEADSFDEQVRLATNSIYMGRLWVFFFHPQFNIIAALGLGVIVYPKFPGLTLVGVLAIMIWGVTEAAQQAFMIDAVNQIWRPGYTNETDETIKQAYHNLLQGAYGFRDSMYFLLVYCYGIGSTLFGLIMIRLDRVAFWIGISLLFFGVLSLVSFVRYYMGADSLSWIVDASYDYVYPWMQPMARLAIGVWVWKAAANQL